VKRAPQFESRYPQALKEASEGRLEESQKAVPPCIPNRSASVCFLFDTAQF
jgi:hypothetical protein